MAPGDLPAFPADTGFDYLAEGGANIVYRFWIKPGTPQPAVLEEYGDGTPPPSVIDDNPVPLWERPYENKLLRLRKNLPTTAPCAVSQDAWERLIATLFPEEFLVDQCLVELRPAKVIERLNEELRGWELYDYPTKGSLRSVDPRPTKRQGIYLADDDHGLLITDMTPGGGEEIMEFKPKWLLQSPSAPKTSKRCRQCARVARLNAERARAGEGPLPSFCPLDLTSKSHRDVLRVAQLMLDPGSTEPKILRLAKWLYNNPLLEKLKTYQMLLDRVGVLEGDPNDVDLLTAMTLRDCTVYVKCLVDGDEVIEARMGDLDLKSPNKIDYWRSVERPLIEEGWYEGLEMKDDWQPFLCQLSPERYGPDGGMRGTAL